MFAAAFQPDRGLDISLIALESNFRISTTIPVINQPITNFRAPTPSVGTVVRAATTLTPPGQATGIITNQSASAWMDVRILGITVEFNRLIATTVNVWPGDSGAALFHNQSVIGVLVGGNPSQITRFFSPVTEYS